VDIWANRSSNSGSQRMFVRVIQRIVIDGARANARLPRLPPDDGAHEFGLIVAKGWGEDPCLRCHYARIVLASYLTWVQDFFPDPINDRGGRDRR
jgi:hypothetical protein